LSLRFLTRSLSGPISVKDIFRLLKNALAYRQAGICGVKKIGLSDEDWGASKSLPISFCSVLVTYNDPQGATSAVDSRVT
jgi:hypothetical protein